jgi:hypothetical protein
MSIATVVVLFMWYASLCDLSVLTVPWTRIYLLSYYQDVDCYCCYAVYAICFAVWSVWTVPWTRIYLLSYYQDVDCYCCCVVMCVVYKLLLSEFMYPRTHRFVSYNAAYLAAALNVLEVLSLNLTWDTFVLMSLAVKPSIQIPPSTQL